jgi:hypothetical protein
MVAFLRSEVELDAAKRQVCAAKNIPTKASYGILTGTAQKLVAVRRKELLDHCAEHGC